MMGGAFSWLFIIQAVLIGNLFLAANYYLWLGMGRVEGVQAYQKYVKYLLATIAICFAVWATPHSLIAAATGIVIFYGIYGYFVEASVRIGSSVYQVESVLFAMVAMTAIDIPLMRGAQST